MERSSTLENNEVLLGKREQPRMRATSGEPPSPLAALRGDHISRLRDDKEEGSTDVLSRLTLLPPTEVAATSKGHPRQGAPGRS